MDLPGACLDTYNRLWLETENVRRMKAEGKFIRPVKMNNERRALMNDLIHFCKEFGYDPQIWLFILFRCRMFRFSPGLTKGALCSKNEKIHNAYKNTKDIHKYRDIIFGKQEIPQFDPNRDIDPTVEAVKQRYLVADLLRVCMANLDQTLGYHPKSGVCQQCSNAKDCLAELTKKVGFDILSLRAGKTTPELVQRDLRKQGRLF